MSYRSVRPPLLQTSRQEDFSYLVSLRRRAIVVLRLLFGGFWIVNSCLAWQLILSHTGTDLLSTQTPMSWNMWWVDLLRLNPYLFASVVALSEMGIALALLLGAYNRLACISGIALSLLLWVSASHLVPGASDLGIMLVYMLVFLCLLLSRAGENFGLDGYWLSKEQRALREAIFSSLDEPQVLYKRSERVKDQHLLPM